MTAILTSISIAALLTILLNSRLGSSKFLNKNRHRNTRILSRTWYPGCCIVPPYEREGGNPSPPSPSPRKPPTSLMVISWTGFDEPARLNSSFYTKTGREGRILPIELFLDLIPTRFMADCIAGRQCILASGAKPKQAKKMIA